jgi:serine protease
VQRAWWRAPTGLGAAVLRRLPGGDGAGGRLIVVEHGWSVDHVALSAAPITVAHGAPMGPADHGAAVLGLLVGRGGPAGDAPSCGADALHIVACADGTGVDRALDIALGLARPGDVVLVQAQAQLGAAAGVPWPLGAGWRAPAGVLVVLPAGNAGVDLDQLDHPGVGDALVVGACAARVPHQVLPRSCHGALVDTWAWGERLIAPDVGWGGGRRDGWTSSFGGTSGAATLIAGLLLCAQGARRARGLPPWSAATWRAHLRDPALGTPVWLGERRVGAMPVLHRSPILMVGPS